MLLFYIRDSRIANNDRGRSLGHFLDSVRKKGGRKSGGEGGILRTSHKHRAILQFFNEFQLGGAVFPLKMAHSTLRILPEMVAKW